MASLESLLCNSCGAPLHVPASARYIKCNHCNTQLSVHRDAGVSFTECIKKLNETTENLKEQVVRLTLQQELADLDRGWDRERQELMISDQHGRKRVPNSAASTIVGIVAVVFGGFWTLSAFKMAGNGPSGLFPLFGLVFMVFGVFGVIHNNAKASQYKLAESRYRAARARLTRESGGLNETDHGSLDINP